MKKIMLFLSLFSLLGVQAADGDTTDDWEFVEEFSASAPAATAPSLENSFTSLTDLETESASSGRYQKHSEKLQILCVEFIQATKNILERYQNHESFDKQKLQQLGRRWRNLAIIIKNPNEFSLSPSALIPNPKNRIKDDKILNYLYTKLQNRKDNSEWIEALYSYKGVTLKHAIELDFIEELIKRIVEIITEQQIAPEKLVALLQEQPFDLSKHEYAPSFVDEFSNVITQFRKLLSPASDVSDAATE